MKKTFPSARDEDCYDTAIVGGGVIGAALLYVLAHYTDIPTIALFEKEPAAGMVNSHSRNNSQTLHTGDIETNYTLEKARSVKEGALMIVRYAERLPKEERERILFTYPKMVLAVGAREVAELEQRFRDFAPVYPWLKRYERKDIAKLEPNIVKGRRTDEPLLALGTETGHAVDFGRLAGSFVEHARAVAGKEIRVALKTRVRRIQRRTIGFELATDSGTIYAKTLVVAAGSHSLLFAKKCGYGKGFSIIPVGGNFYYTPQVLRGKVYTMQNKLLPFAAVHGDPDVSAPGKTRFGPTAKLSPTLEGGSWRTALDYLRSADLDYDALASYLKILSNPVQFRYLVQNILYDLPVLGKRLFIRTVRKIVPTLERKDLSFARGVGGMRMQNVDTKKRTLLFGESKIVGRSIIFNMTPSPGASVSLQNAMRDAELLTAFLGSPFDSARFRRDFME